MPRERRTALAALHSRPVPEIMEHLQGRFAFLVVLHHQMDTLEATSFSRPEPLRVLLVLTVEACRCSLAIQMEACLEM